MGVKIDPKKTVSFEELALSNMYEIQGLINLLDRKGVISKAELLKEIINLKENRSKKSN